MVVRDARLGGSTTAALATLSVTRQQVLAFRLANHNLATRLPLDSLLLAIGACGVQNTPPGAAALSLGARVTDFSPPHLAFHLADDKRLLQAWSLRGAPHVFPTHAAAVFTSGLLPRDEESLRAFILGIAQGLAVIGMTATEVVRYTASAVRHVLDQRVVVGKKQLDLELADFVAGQLPPQRSAVWHSPSPYAPGQTLGEALVSFALRPVSLQGLVCFVPRDDGQAAFARTEQWLGRRLPPSVRVGAGAELVRRYLHCYGPASLPDFAAWAGISGAQAQGAWSLVSLELARVELEGREAWLYRPDADQLLSARLPAGVRFLPAHDPYLQSRDRTLLVPDGSSRARIWRAAGAPGAVLVDGELAATWRSHKFGAVLQVTVEFLTPAPTGRDPRLDAEAQALAPVAGCQSVELTLQPTETA